MCTIILVDRAQTTCECQACGPPYLSIFPRVSPFTDNCWTQAPRDGGGRSIRRAADHPVGLLDVADHVLGKGRGNFPAYVAASLVATLFLASSSAAP